MASNFVIGNIGLYKTYEEAVNDYPNGLNSFIKKFSTYTCDNSLQYATSPYRDNSFTMRNDETVVSAKYVPEVSFTFYAMNEETYQNFIQLTNTRGFYVRYYDFEIGLDVIRYMYMTDQSRDQIKIAPPDADNPLGFIQHIIGLKITFVSKLAYESYDDLKEKAQGDSRMLPRVETPEFARVHTIIDGVDVELLIISVEEEGATIRYTTDSVTSATINNTNWSIYESAINLSEITETVITITAQAQKEGMNDSYLAKWEWDRTEA